ncbi:hypothetical protein [Streptomyces sp. NPDC005538]|uniref:hypothetical protein n=1 Tax=unclassified Streptomyces TaxID=2593676 RepID=UPI0033B5DF82
MGERVDDGELDRLADEAAEVLELGLGLPDRAGWEAVRRDFMAWFGRRGLDAYAQDLGAVEWGRGRSSDQELPALWHRQLREGIGRPSDIAAAGELRALVKWLIPTVLAPPESGVLLDTGPSISPPPLPESTGGDLFDFRSGTFNGQVVGVQHVRNTYGAPPPGEAQPGPVNWPLAKDIEPLTHGVRPTRRVKDLPALPPYVGREQDAAVNSALKRASSRSGLVVVQGQAYVGKSRTALAAIAEVFPRRRVFAPAQHEDLRKLPALLHGRAEPCVVWLDDLDGHLGECGLEPRLLARLTALEAVVLATMREEAYDKCVGTSAHGRLLDLAELVDLPATWEAAELARAKDMADPRLVEAARESGTSGVATYLAIGPRLWKDWQRARNAARHPRAHALVRAALDLARCGFKGPVPQDLLVTVHEGYGIAGLEKESLEDALEWAGRRRYGVLRMLARGMRDDRPVWEVLPYLVHTAEQDEGFPPVAGWVWRHALAAVSGNPAHDFEVTAGARQAFLREAEAGDARAMHSLGVLDEAFGAWEEAESWFRRAADTGWPESAGHVGRLLVQRGESRQAEPYLETAAEAGDDEAATLLGTLLRERAAKWFGAAADLGNPEAAHRLGDLLLADGDFEGAGDRYLAAERSGYAEAARSTGMLHLLANEPGKAHVLLTRAVEAGDEPAVTLLADMRGDPQTSKEVADYFSSTATYPLDNAHHGVVMEEEGRPREARKDYEKGHAAGDPYAAYRLALLLEKQGNPEEAKLWYRKAADMDHPAALKALAEHPATPDTVKE